MKQRPLTIACPVCPSKHPIEGLVAHDPGRRYTANGDGWPESWDVEFDEAQCPAAIPQDEWNPHSPIARIEDAFVEAYRNG